MGADITDTRREMLGRVFEQNWLHARHIETQRLQVFGFYALLVVAVFALTGQGILESLKNGKAFETPILFLLLMIVLTVVFALFSLRLECEFHQHSLLATHTADKLGLGNYMGRPLDQRSNTLITRWLSIPLFGSFYVTWFCFFIAQILGQYVSLLAASLAFFPLVFITWYAYVWFQKHQYDKIDEAVKLGSLPDLKLFNMEDSSSASAQ